MSGTASAKRPRIHGLAWQGFVLSLFALLLAWYGSLHAEKQLPGSPLHQARGVPRVPREPGPWYEKLWDKAETGIFGGPVDRKVLALTERSKFARYGIQVVAFVIPFLAGIGAALMGATALRAIEQSRGQRAGNFPAVFSIMIGGFAAVIAGCMMVSIYLWPHVPSLYTQ